MRSKALLVSSILASLYSIVISEILIGLVIIDVYSQKIINIEDFFWNLLFIILKMDESILSIDLSILYAVRILLLIHIGLFVIGSIVSLVAYAARKDIVAIVAAVIFFIATVYSPCSPICFVFAISITVLAFIGASNQTELNKKRKLKIGGNSNGK